MTNIAILIENLSKQYRLGTVGTGTLRDDLNRWWHRIRGKEDPYLKIGETNDRAHRGNSEYVWALRDINLEVKQGEVLGIIGKNGAGKSTLLKILSKVTGPTTGRIMAKGRIASLLEVGTGFHSELTGRENIYLNGAILGMTKAEVSRKLDEIVDFAGVERYLDTPVKRYSSGMTVRLGFAVAAFLEEEILIVDEVLAVGDAEFQKKAIGKMQEVSSGGGRTVLFVSHNMGSISRLCEKVVVMDDGFLIFKGETVEGIKYYLEKANEKAIQTGEITWTIDQAPGEHEMKLLAVRLKNYEEEVKSVFSTAEPIIIEVDYLLEKTVTNMRVNFRVLTSDEQILLSSSSHDSEEYTKTPGHYRCQVSLPANLLNQGNFKIFVQAGCPNIKELVSGRTYLEFSTEKFYSSGTMEKTVLPGLIAPELKWDTRWISQNHHGL